MSRGRTHPPTLPDWCRVRIDQTLPAHWQDLARQFLCAAVQIVRSESPRRGLIRFRNGGDHMQIRVLSVPPMSEDTQTALQALGTGFAELSRCADGVACQADVLGVTSTPGTPALITDDPAVSGVSNDVRVSKSNDEIQVFRWDEGRTAGGADLGRHEESAVRIAKAIRRLRATGPMRPVYPPPDAWASMLDSIETAFPNFSEVIRCVVRPHAALSAKGLRHRMPPLLLVGPPGIGKTKFAQTLAKALGLPSPLFVSIAAETNGSRLGGSSTFWSNASPGDLFESLAWGHRGGPAIANGLIVIDEIDKVSTRDYDPLGALYNLLEADTAREFVDQALPDVIVDASHLHVISTANVLESVPLPLRSRMLTFEIAQSPPEQAAYIVRQIFEELVSRMNIKLRAALPEPVISDAATVEPRQAKMLLEAALANALVAGRESVETHDWLAVRSMVKARKSSIGFVSSH